MITKLTGFHRQQQSWLEESEEKRMSQLMLSLISHEIEGKLVHQRAVDGYVNATAMCSAVGKQFFDYHRLKSTEEFMAELASDTGIPVSRLVISRKGNTNSYEQGTWIHTDAAIMMQRQVQD